MTKYSTINMDKKKSEVLVVHCSDPRFQEAYRQIIDDLGEYYDLLVFPGASKAVAENESVIDSIKLLHDLHYFKIVHILDHISCGVFGEVRDEQIAHSDMLKLAADKLASFVPGIKVVPHLLGEKDEIKIL